MDEQLEILRRIAKAGKKEAEEVADCHLPNQLDRWIHMLDEIERAKICYQKERS